MNLVARLTAAETRRPTDPLLGLPGRPGRPGCGRCQRLGPRPPPRTGWARLGDGFLNGDRRRNLKRCRNRVELRLCRDPDLFEAQGYRVFRSAQDRLHYWPDLTEPEYRKVMRARVADTRRMFMVGLVERGPGGLP